MVLIEPGRRARGDDNAVFMFMFCNEASRGLELGFELPWRGLTRLNGYGLGGIYCCYPWWAFVGVIGCRLGV